jgi:hypothetical protein
MSQFHRRYALIFGKIKPPAHLVSKGRLYSTNVRPAEPFNRHSTHPSLIPLCFYKRLVFSIDYEIKASQRTPSNVDSRFFKQLVSQRPMHRVTISYKQAIDALTTAKMSQHTQRSTAGIRRPLTGLNEKGASTGTR